MGGKRTDDKAEFEGHDQSSKGAICCRPCQAMSAGDNDPMDNGAAQLGLPWNLATSKKARPRAQGMSARPRSLPLTGKWATEAKSVRIAKCSRTYCSGRTDV